MLAVTNHESRYFVWRSGKTKTLAKARADSVGKMRVFITAGYLGFRCELHPRLSTVGLSALSTAAL
jgi:hypothetical protein